MQGEHSVTHIAELLPQLPGNARVFVAEDNDRIWTFADTLTATLVNSLNGLIWGMGDPRKRGRKPEPIGPRVLTEKGKKSLPARVMPVSELIETLSKPRR